MVPVAATSIATGIERNAIGRRNSCQTSQIRMSQIMMTTCAIDNEGLLGMKFATLVHMLTTICMLGFGGEREWTESARGNKCLIVCIDWLGGVYIYSNESAWHPCE